MDKPKGFIFDLDGTLTLTQHLHYLALHEVFNKYGIDYTQKEDQEKYSGKGSKYTCEQVLKSRGKDSSPAEIEKCAAAKKESYDKIIEAGEIKPVPGVSAFLEKARTAGIKMIVATGNKAAATAYLLDKAGLSGYFKKIISQSDVKNQKPAPDLFLKAASELGLKPDECVVFEDALNGVTAAKSGGIPCIALTTGSPAEELLKAGAAMAVADYTDKQLIKLFN
jgi:beta-phosphoglucomutase